ncbi:MAG TPA: amidase [Cytophagaceae bacterium]|jgi:amidase
MIFYNKNIPFLPAAEILDDIHSRKISVEDVVKAFLTQIRKYNYEINAITDLRGEEDLLEEARNKDELLAKGILLGDLHGLPMTVKDSFNVKGLKTSNGHPLYKDNIATEDAELVKRLKASGAVIMGKTNLPLFSIDWKSTNFWYGQTNNPYDRSRVPGGSSGGSAAALAIGFTPLELGSDAGGSIRVPSHFCGVCGIRTTEQALSNRGQFKFPAIPQGHRMVTVSGPLARNVGDLLLALKVLWTDGNELSEIPPVGFNASGWSGGKLRIAYSSTLYNLEIDKEYSTLIEVFLDKLRLDGHSVQENKPIYDANEAYELNGVFMGHEIDACAPVPSILTKIFFYFFILIKYRDFTWAAGVWKGIGMSASKLMEALEKKERIADSFLDFFNNHDVWITPVASIAAFKHQKTGKPFVVNGKKVKYTDAIGRFSFDSSLGGHPIVVIPLGQTKEGLPVGISIHAKKWTDKRLLEICKYFEKFTEGFRIPNGY